ncbi:G-protein coupled receptor 12-like [Nematostella vectensis]|uniref:G-protein coupled receptor 12-like n=1 Tax=Nematostella vectensis TaxID=45351 RepID=UPI002076D6CF|nr:G-protein coupled receptor 12-like [Nematostella vectensis]
MNETFGFKLNGTIGQISMAFPNETRETFCYFLPDAEFDKVPLRYRSNLVTAIINIVFAPIAVLANFLVVYVIFRTPNLRQPSTILLGCLALSDIFVGSLVQPSYVAFRLMENKLHFVPCFVRMLYSNGFYICYGVSFMTLSAISFERFVALTLHLRYRALVTTSRLLKIAIVIWAIDIILTGLQWSGINKVICAIHLTLWITCLLTSAFIHFRVIKIVRRHQKDIRQQQLQTASLSFHKQTKLAMNIAYIVGSYFLFNFPVLFVTTFHQIASGSLGTYAFYNWTETIAFLNSSINPLVCCWRNRNIRKAVYRLIKTGFCNNDSIATEEEFSHSGNNKFIVRFAANGQKTRYDGTANAGCPVESTDGDGLDAQQDRN